MPRRVLIANRGAIARRVIATCNRLGIESVAVFSPADEPAPYLAEATRVLALPGNEPQASYLNQTALLAVLEDSGADAVHPGYGFLAENAEFAEAVAAAGATFIGPDPRWLRTMGDKVAARGLLAERDFPVLPGSSRIEDLDEAQQAAREIGFPVMLKPSGGGGGIGMSVVRDNGELARSFHRARDLASRMFGDEGVYLEAFLERPRHIEYQLLGDQHGNAAHLHERECSVQRRHQKVIEETPAPGIDPEVLLDIANRATEAIRSLGYDSVGTFETLYGADGRSGFLEMNTRIQVEHGVTEMVTGVDLVAMQMAIADGERLPAMPVRQGFALEVRVYAEDPVTELPSTGRLHTYQPPELFGVRVDTGYGPGQWVTPHYDPLLAKVIGHGATREQAIGRVLVALQAFEIRGVDTNIPLLKRILRDQQFLQGEIDTGFLPRFRQRSRQTRRVSATSVVTT